MEGAFAPSHIIVIALLFLVLFGAKRLPDSARALGQSLRILKAETRGLHSDDAKAAEPAVFDVRTGQRLAPAPAGTPVFDAQTGAQHPAAVPARFDPHTGEPVA